MVIEPQVGQGQQHKNQRAEQPQGRSGRAIAVSDGEGAPAHGRIAGHIFRVLGYFPRQGGQEGEERGQPRTFREARELGEIHGQSAQDRYRQVTPERQGFQFEVVEAKQQRDARGQSPVGDSEPGGERNTAEIEYYGGPEGRFAGQSAGGKRPMGAIDTIGGQIERIILHIAGGGQHDQGQGTEDGGMPVQRPGQAGMAEPNPEACHKGVGETGQFDPVADHGDNVS